MDRRIEAVAFSRTVNQVLTGDQIDRLVLSARKVPSGFAFCSSIPVSSFFAYFYCYPRRLDALSHYFDCPSLIISLREDCPLRFARTSRGRKIEASYNCVMTFTVSRAQNAHYIGERTRSKCMRLY